LGEGFNKAVCQVSSNLKFLNLSGEELKCEKKLSLRIFETLQLHCDKKHVKKTQLRPKMTGCMYTEHSYAVKNPYEIFPSF
jgi:hypothetical protein